MIKISAVRYHDICMGHRVVGHEGKCKNLHGHNYRFHFTVEAKKLDEIGRVIDFSVIKSTLCEWLEEYWDHKMILWQKDPLLDSMYNGSDLWEGIVPVPFNPTAENIAEYFLKDVAPFILGEDVVLTKVVIEETRKCSVECSLH